MKTYPPGTRIGQYEITGRPLMGGMGIVYICIDTETDRPVALKTFRPELLPDRAARDRFLREGTAWVDLGAHPHIVRCYRVFQPENAIEVYLVLELIAKEHGRDDASLRAWLPPGAPQPTDLALLFALQIARGMKHATDVIPRFVHRDLKPENVLVGSDRLSNSEINRLRVTDFGLVRALAASEILSSVDEDEPLPECPGLTRGGTVLGTPNYMAPEQWERTDVDLRADIYALGCILGEMLIGHILIRERTYRAFKQAHQEGRAGEAVTSLPVKIAELLAHCLALEPGKRYQDWEQVEAALVAAHEAVTGRPAPEAEPVAFLSRAERMAAGWSYSAMGASYLDIGKAEVAAGYFERAREAGEAEGERKLAATGLTHLGLAYADQGDARRAIGYYKQALEIAREIGDRGGEGAVLGNLAVAYVDLGDARRAIGYYEQALEIVREIGNRGGEGATLGNLGEAYRLLGDARRAIGYYEQQLVITREIGDRRGEGNALGNLGTAYAGLGDARRAIGYYEQCLAIHREIGNRRGEGTTLGNLGSAYLQLSDARSAIGYYEQALTIDREIGDIAGTAADSFNMAVLYAQQGGTSRALELAQQAARIWGQTGHAQYAQRAQQLVALLQGGAAPIGGPTPAQILQQFARVIEAVVAAAHGNPQARTAVEAAFDQLDQLGWRIIDPIRRIWAGERDEAALTTGIDSNSALIVREILKQLGT